MTLMEEFEERLAAEPYEVEVEKTRFAYWVSVTHGLSYLGSEFGGTHRWTRRGADRWAQRAIRKDQERSRQRREAIRYEVQP